MGRQRYLTSNTHTLALVVALAATAALGDSLTLAEAQRRALVANPSLRIARLETVAARERTLQAYARHLGEGDLVVQGNHFEGARLVRPITGPLTPTVTAALPFDANQLHAGLTWQIPLFAGGALVEADQAARLLETAATAQAAHTAAELRYNVGAAFRSVLGLGHALTAAAAWETALEHEATAAQLRVKTEAWSNADALKVDFALASAKSRRATLDAQRRTALAYLGALVGEELPAELELIEPEAGSSEPPSATDGEALRHRKDLVSLQTSADAQEHRVASVRAGFWPQIGLAGNVFLNAGAATGPSTPSLEVTLFLKLPLLGAVGRVPALREAEATAAVSKERARARALEVRTQVLDAQGRVAAARAAVAAGTAQRTLGVELARTEKLRLDSGTGRVEDYLLALAQQFEGETSAWQAGYALESARDFLALATGTGENP
jgi:outer membrane protein TolC